MTTRRELLQAAGGAGALAGLFGTGVVAQSDESETRTMGIPQGTHGRFQTAATISALNERGPDVALTEEGWVYRDETTDDWKQLRLGTDTTPIPDGNFDTLSTETLNRTRWIPPEAGSEGIQAAIDSLDTGGVVRLASETYECDSQIRLKGSVWLVGSGRSTELRFADGFNDHLIILPPGSEHCRVSSLSIDGNKTNNSQGDCIHIEGYNWRPIIDRIVIRDGPGNGINALSNSGEYTYEPIIIDVDIKGVNANGFNLGFLADLFGMDLYAEASGGVGMKLMGAAGTIFHPHVYDSQGEAGLVVDSTAQDLRLFGAHLDTNRRHGAILKGERITLNSAFVFDNSKASTNSYDGVVLDGATQSIITGGTFANTDDERTQRYGLTETGTAGENIVALNQFVDNATGGTRKKTGSNSEFQLNME